MSVLGWGPGSWVMTKKILIVMSDPMIFAPLGTTTKTGKQANYRSAHEWIQRWVHVHSATYLHQKKEDIMQSPATEKEGDVVIPSEVRETGSSKYHMVSLLGVI